MMVRFILEDEGFEVIVAEDGEQALELARTRIPDAILLDQVMPKLDGRAVLEQLRSNAATKTTPVFVLSGMELGRPDEWPGALFLRKPFDPVELLRRLRELARPQPAN